MPEFLSLFDVADPELVVGQRDVTTIAPQALYMMNSPVVLEQSEAAGRAADRQRSWPTTPPASITPFAWCSAARPMPSSGPTCSPS